MARKNKMTREQRIMFTRIFIGLHREADEKLGVKAEYVKPSLTFISRQFPELDVEPIATELGMELMVKGTVFNYTYGKLKLHDKCKREYNKQLTQLKRETMGLATGDIVTDMNQPDVVEPPEIAGNAPLTEAEGKMVEYLMAGMTQRDIYTQHRVHPAKQLALRKAIEQKMEVI